LKAIYLNHTVERYIINKNPPCIVREILQTRAAGWINLFICNYSILFQRRLPRKLNECCPKLRVLVRR